MSFLGSARNDITTPLETTLQLHSKRRKKAIRGANFRWCERIYYTVRADLCGASRFRWFERSREPVPSSHQTFSLEIGSQGSN
jgi:hypothetical protein